MKRWITASVMLGLANAALFSQSLKLYTEISPPNQLQERDGRLTGLVVEVVREIQKRLGNTDPLQVMPWARAYSEVRSQPNVVLFSMGRTAERDPLFQWVGPVNEATFSLYMKASSGIALRSLEDAKRLRRIGVYRDDARDLFLTEAGFTNLDRITDNQANVKKLMAGRLEAFTSSRTGIAELVASAGFKPEDVKEALPFMQVQLFLAFSKKTPEGVVKAWSATLDGMKKDRTFERIFRKYQPTQPLPGPATTHF